MLLSSLMLLPGGAAAASPRSGPGEPPVEGRPIERISWEGLRTLAPETVAHYLGLETGEPLDPTRLDSGIRALWTTGLVDDVVVRAEATDTGVALAVEVEERPRLRSIELGELEATVREEARRRFADLLPTPGLPRAVERADLEVLRRGIEELVRRDGRPAARVAYELIEERPGEVSAAFSVVSPERPRIVAIRFEGNLVFADRRLRRAMRRNRVAGVLATLGRRGRWDPQGIEEDLDAIRDLYRRHGFKDVAVAEPRLDRVESPGGEPRVSLEIPIEEGTRWKLGGLSVDGNRSLSDQRLIARFRPAHEPWLDLGAVDRWLQSVLALYRSRGRIDTTVTHELRERPGGEVDVFARVEEGEPLTVGRVRIEGNRRTRERVLRRELSVREGETLDAEALAASLARIERRGLLGFGDDPVELRRRGDGVVDLVVRGHEVDTFQTGFGGGWSQEDGGSAHATIQTGNLLGRGHAAGLRAVAGDLRDEFELFYDAPWVGGRRHSLGGELFARSFAYALPSDDRFRREETGGALVWGLPLGGGQRLRLAYTRADLDDLQSRRDEEGAEIRRELSRRHSALRALWTLDRRDEPLDPTRGVYASASLETAGGVLGGDTRFHRAEVSFSLFRALTRSPATRLALRLAGGWIEPRGGVALSPLETWFLGGLAGPRGFASRSLAARSERSDRLLRDELGFLVGGTRYLGAGIEYHLALRGPLSAVLFLDAGNVYAETQSFDPGRLRPTGGIELRLELPKLGLPLRLIYSENLDPLPGDRFESVGFRIGGGF